MISDNLILNDDKTEFLIAGTSRKQLKNFLQDRNSTCEDKVILSSH